MIPQSTIDRIIDATNIVDVVSDYVTLRRAGASYKGLCPFHDDKTPSFSVSPARGVCKCFSCGKGGNAVHFIMEMEQLTYHEAIRHLGKKYGIHVEEEKMTDEQRKSMNERESMFAINEWASKYFNETMQKHPDGRAIGLNYFRSRGFRDDIIEKFRLGFCLDTFDSMGRQAKASGYQESYLVSTGLCLKRDNGSIYDRFRGRAMFPWFAINGKIVAFGGRVLDSRTKGVNQKYVNSPDSAIFHKANELYGIYQAKKAIAKEDFVFMVEGYTDVLSMHQCGIENVVANSGTALNEAQIHMLHRFTNNIVLIYDGDEAGIHAATRSTDMLLAEGMNVKILLLPDGDDPDSFAHKHTAAEFKQYVSEHQTDFILFKSNLLLHSAQRDPLKKAQLTEDIIKSIAIIPDEIVRSTYVHECAEILDMDESVLLRGTNRNRAALLQQVKEEIEREKKRKEHLLAIENQKANNPQDNTTPQTAQTSPAGDNQVQNSDDDFPPLEVLNIPPDQNAVTQSDITASGNNNKGGNTLIDTTSITSKSNYAEQHIIGIEKQIMTLITRYGEFPFQENPRIDNTENDASAETEQQEINIAEYVYYDLAHDGINFRSPLYSKMFAAIIPHIQEEGFSASRILLNNPDEDISREAADLISERYQLSSGNKMTQTEHELSSTYITRYMLDYKYAIIEEELKRCTSELTRPEIKNDATKFKEVMQEYMQLSNIQRELAKHLGERVFQK